MRWATLARVSTLFVIATVPAFGGQPEWTALSVPSPGAAARYDDIYFVTPEMGWIVNGIGNIYKTTDGGSTWVQQFHAAQYLRCCGFADSLHGWVGTLDSSHVLYHTSDGGVTWNEVTNIPPPHPAGICGLSVVNDSVIFGSGKYTGPARVIKSTDGGATWTTLDLSPYAATLIDCKFFSADSGFVVGGTGRFPDSIYAIILSTSDGGKSWTRRFFGKRTNEWTWKIFFPSATTGYASLEREDNAPAYFAKTTDGGVTWGSRLFSFNRFDEEGIGFINDSVGWLGGWGGQTWETRDGGDTWNPISVGFYANRFRFFSDHLGYCSGAQVYRFNGLTPTIAPDNPVASVPLTPRLEQNYPNPFNPTTTIRYVLPRTAAVSLIVYNLLGEQVAQLVERAEAAGEHSVTFNAGDLPSGAYFYRLKANGTELTKSLLLIR